MKPKAWRPSQSRSPWTSEAPAPRSAFAWCTRTDASCRSRSRTADDRGNARRSEGGDTRRDPRLLLPALLRILRGAARLWPAVARGLQAGLGDAQGDEMILHGRRTGGGQPLGRGSGGVVVAHDLELHGGVRLEDRRDVFELLA